MEMIVGQAEREAITKEVAGGEKVWWMMPGWIRFRHRIFTGLSKGCRMMYSWRPPGGTVILDSIGYFDQLKVKNPTEFLECCDWIGGSVKFYRVSLDRFKSFLLEQALELNK
jgi:hypothetical protein